MSACTCSPCGRQFTGLAAFDKHQDVDYARRPAVVCQDPATVGLVLNRGRWGEPLDAAGRERLRNLRAEQAARVPTGTPRTSEPSTAPAGPQESLREGTR